MLCLKKTLFGCRNILQKRLGFTSYGCTNLARKVVYFLSDITFVFTCPLKRFVTRLQLQHLKLLGIFKEVMRIIQPQ